MPGNDASLQNPVQSAPEEQPSEDQGQGSNTKKKLYFNPSYFEPEMLQVR